MCARYELVSPTADLLELLSLDAQDAREALGEAIQKPDIRPSDEVWIATGDEPHRLVAASWGLLGTWSEPKPGQPALRPFNARDDKLAGGMWRPAFEHQRCLVPATAFFEWKEVPGRKKKQPIKFSMKDKAPFCFAGLWSRYRDRVSCTIITTTPSPLVSTVHDRMPAILSREAMSAWLSRESLPDALAGLIGPYPEFLMTAEEAAPAALPSPARPLKPQLDLF